MEDYFEERKYFLEDVYFKSGQIHYKGQGTMTWKPNSGFRVEASLKRHGSIPTVETYPDEDSIFEPEDRTTIHLKPQGYAKAIIPSVSLKHDIDLFMNEQLTIEVDRVFFFLTKPSGKQFSALYHIVGNPVFPDYLSRNITINNGQESIEDSWAAKAIRNEKPHIWGYIDSRGILQLNWGMYKQGWTEKDGWHFPEGARIALSILLGQDIQLLQRTTLKRMEKRKYSSTRKLNFYLLPTQDSRDLNREEFMHLATFFTKKRNSMEVLICRSIFNQMVDASGQQTLEAAQLLLGTILEATFRTLYNYPYVSGAKNAFNLKNCMEKFQGKYLTVEWSDACAKAVKVFKELRHRNAHPDWIITPGGSWSQDAIPGRVSNMAFLSQFYGYMIKALAGFPNLKPNFE